MINTYPIYLRIVRWCFRRMLRQVSDPAICTLSMNRLMYKTLFCECVDLSSDMCLSALWDGLDGLVHDLDYGRDI